MAAHEHSDSAWATGDVPVAPDPAIIRWDAAVSTDGSPAGTALGEPLSTGSGAAAPQPGGHDRNRRLPTIALVIVALLATALVATRLGDDGPTGKIDGIAEVTPTTLGALPTVDDEAEVDDETDEPAIEEPGVDTVDDSLPAGGGGTTESGTSSATASIDVPDGIAALAGPTEIIALDTNSRLVTVSLPSGNVRSVDVSLDSTDGFFGRTVTSPDATMLTSYDGPSLIVPREGPAVVLDLAQFGDGNFSLDADSNDVDDVSQQIQLEAVGWVNDARGVSRFLTIVYDNIGELQPRTMLIDLDGVATVPVGGTSTSPFSTISASGTYIVNDAGGAYRVEVDGTVTRVSTGSAIATSPDGFVLLRTCDEALACIATVQRLDGSDTREVTLDASAVDAFARAALSPGGVALSYDSYFGNGKRIIVDLDTGAITEHDLTSPSPIAAWARDGSGQFAVNRGPGFRFVAPGSDDEITFGAELGQFQSLGVRYPDEELAVVAIVENNIGLSAEPAGEIGIDVVTIGRTGGMSHVDLDGGTVASWDTPGVPGNRAPTVVARGDEVLAISGVGTAAVYATYGTGRAIDDDLVPDTPAAPGPAAGQVWTPATDASPGVDVDMVVIDFDGVTVPDSPTVTANGELIGHDGAGGLIVVESGSTYVTNGIDVVRLTTGDLIAVGPRSALVRECDVDFACSMWIVDRATGDRSETPFIDSVDGPEERGFVSWAGSLSPDGDVALMRIDSQWVFFELSTGLLAGISTPTVDQPVVWNGDASYAVFASENSLSIYERSSSSIIGVSAIPGVRGFAAADDSFVTE